MKPLVRKLLSALWNFAKDLGRIARGALWRNVKGLAETFVIMVAFFYLWACFGTGQPQRLLNGHEAWAVFDQCMTSIREKGCPR